LTYGKDWKITNSAEANGIKNISTKYLDKFSRTSLSLEEVNKVFTDRIESTNLLYCPLYAMNTFYWETAHGCGEKNEHITFSVDPDETPSVKGSMDDFSDRYFTVTGWRIEELGGDGYTLDFKWSFNEQNKVTFNILTNPNAAPVYSFTSWMFSDVQKASDDE
jgi:hypothetical protein